MVGSTGTAERWAHHLVRTPKSGRHALAWVVECRLFPQALKAGEEKQPFSMICTMSQYEWKWNTQQVRHLWLSQIPSCFFRGIKEQIHISILPHCGASALQVPSLRQMAERNPRNSKPGSQRKVTRAPEWRNRPSVDPCVGTGGLRQPITEHKHRHDFPSDRRSSIWNPACSQWLQKVISSSQTGH